MTGKSAIEYYNHIDNGLKEFLLSGSANGKPRTTGLT